MVPDDDDDDEEVASKRNASLFRIWEESSSLSGPYQTGTVRGPYLCTFSHVPAESWPLGGGMVPALTDKMLVVVSWFGPQN